MGGSGICGDIINSLAPELNIKIPIYTHKDRSSPKYKNSGIVFVSFSGETEETYSSFKKTLSNSRKNIIGVVSSGGKLIKLAKANKVNYVIIKEKNLTPRYALGYNVFAVLTLLKSFSPTLRVKGIFGNIEPKNLEKKGKDLAYSFSNKIPLIYTDYKRKSIGYSWKMYFNETGKIPAFSNIFPETTHNEVQSFKKNKYPFEAIFLKTKDLNAKTKKQMTETSKLLSREGIKSTSIEISGKNETERLWNGVLLGAWTGLYIAKGRKVNPEETSIINTLKKRVK